MSSSDREGVHLNMFLADHPDDECWDCTGCDHPSCWHSDDWAALNGLGTCERAGCDCMAAVTADDPLMASRPCRTCDGSGEVAVNQPRDPADQAFACCPTCLGNGIHHPVEDEQVPA
jgi:hypothetical protein